MFKRINKLAIELPIPAHGDMNLCGGSTRTLGWQVWGDVYLK